MSLTGNYSSVSYLSLLAVFEGTQDDTCLSASNEVWKLDSSENGGCFGGNDIRACRFIALFKFELYNSKHLITVMMIAFIKGQTASMLSQLELHDWWKTSIVMQYSIQFENPSHEETSFWYKLVQRNLIRRNVIRRKITVWRNIIRRYSKR